jgi:hypothetical protein
MYLRTVLVIAYLAWSSVCLGAESGPGKLQPKTWVDKDTGHRIWNLVPDTQSTSLYFTKNAFSPDGDTMLFIASEDVTRCNWERLADFKYSTLPLHDAIKTVRGNGARTLVTFEDPNCLYCKKLHRELQKLSNVTIYTFMVPILSEDSHTKAAEIWCSNEGLRSKI